MMALAAVAGCGRSTPATPTPSTASPNPAIAPAERTPVATTTPALPAGPFRFRDRAGAKGIEFVHTSGQSPEKYYPTLFGSGVALLDFDGDGLLDLYFADTRDLPLDAATKAVGNRLYRNRGDHTYEDVTELAGVGFRGFCQGLAAGDFDGDGFADLLLANLGPCVLYLNNGDGTFRDASKGSGLDVDGWWTSAAPLDFDGDGDLDVYLCRYSPWTVDGPHPECFDRSRRVRTVCSPTMLPADRHFLFRNRGDGTFDDATAAAGVLRRDGRGLGVIAADLDLDGKVDLFVTNDLCPNFVFRNKGDGTFEDRTESSGAARSGEGADQSGMGVDAEDLDGDGFPELILSHFRGEYATLYRNLRGGQFRDDSARAGLVSASRPYVGWGCALADFDNDSELDLLIVNGHVEDNLVELGRGIPQAEPSLLWRNRGKGRFVRVGGAGPFFDADHVARGAGFGDLDDDGDLDAVVTLMDARPALLDNETPDPGSWVRLDLIGRRSNRGAIGAIVEVHAGGRTITRQVKGGGSYLSSNDPRLLIGLGRAERVDRVVVRWPGGARSELTDLAVRRTHRLREPLAAGP